MQLTAKQLAEILHGTVEGNPEAQVTSFAKIEHGKPGQLCFFANPKYEQYVYTSRASVLLVNRDFTPKAEVAPTLVRVENAYNALTELLAYVSAEKKKYRRRRSLRSRIAWSARLGKRVSVGAFVSIGKDCHIGDCTVIHDNVTIGAGTKIGSHCIIYPGVHVFPGMVIGDRVILHAGCIIGDDGFGNAPQPDGTWRKIEHLGNVIIGNDVEVGSNTTIDRAPMESTIIEDGARIDNLCMIAHNVVVGKNTVMAAQTGIAGSTKIGESCLFGGQVGIVGHVKIADHTTIGAKSAVIGNVRKPGETYWGVPAILHKTYLKAYAKFKRAGEEDNQ
ncbi:MAG: UDP-3-O-(3-hydroxymyristoyl)glucosamine N-acyltransferase [Bacteroidales bacterium]|nr:UDP-3-O-(3-hydroxymyristoyl)glucosamine N-acyltransferase [Bacteroidales bacterium]